MSLIKAVLLISYFSMKKKIGMIQMIFDIENWLWKSEFCDLHGQISNRPLICQRPFTVRKCYLPFNQAIVWCGSSCKILKWHLLTRFTALKSKIELLNCWELNWFNFGRADTDFQMRKSKQKRQKEWRIQWKWEKKTPIVYIFT